MTKIAEYVEFHFSDHTMKRYPLTTHMKPTKFRGIRHNGLRPFLAIIHSVEPRPELELELLANLDPVNNKGIKYDHNSM